MLLVRARVGLGRRLPDDVARAEMMRVGLTPDAPFPGVHRGWRCTCTLCGRPASLSLASVRVRLSKSAEDPATGCDACVAAASGKSRMIQQADAERRMEELGMRPLGTYPGSTEPWPAVCLRCGSRVSVLLSKAYGRGRACPTCSHQSRAEHFRKPENQAVEVMLGAGFQPLEPYVNTRHAWRSIHVACGRETSPSLTSIERGGGGCSFCAKYGFDAASPAVLYLLHHPRLAALKVGITGTGTDRLGYMVNRRGWETLRTVTFAEGWQARQIEREVLRWWRMDRGAPIALHAAEVGRRGGWTETAHTACVSADDTLEYVRRLTLQVREEWPAPVLP